MLRIRLQRVGRKNEPVFRVIATEHQNAAKTGRVLEILGNYDPRFDKVAIKGERVSYWISKGAKPTSTMHNLLVSQKIIEGKKVNVLSRKSPIKPALTEASEKEGARGTEKKTIEEVKGGDVASAADATEVVPDETTAISEEASSEIAEKVGVE